MTSQHDALYRAICDHPDEDTPRLAFADLVEEDGDPAWAAFIRTQVDLARVPEYDPLWAKCRQFNPDAMRGWGMAHTLPTLPSGFTKQTHLFRRGFLWRVGVRHPAAFREEAAGLFAAAPVRCLDFDDRHRPDLAELAACSHLARLRRLEFTGTGFRADDLAPLGESSHAENLTGLAFEYGAIDADGLEALAGSPLFGRLEVLELGNNVIPPALLVDALGAALRHGSLRRLSLRFCDIPPPDARHLFALPVMRGLDHLDLGNNDDLGPDGIEALTESGVVRGLAVLKLAKTLPGVPGLRSLTETSGLSRVRWLDLSANRLGPVAAGVLADARAARGLRVLDLSDNQLGNKGAEALAGSRHLAGLVELVLADCGIGDAGATALAESPYLDGLLRLDVRDRSVGRPLGDAARRALVDRFGPRVAFNQE
ncbi:MAG: hypothetical protein JWO38_7384 [Gemmataceae bacterium]|nr:hypothetical protein [Gemmataceae bacterium]